MGWVAILASKHLEPILDASETEPRSWSSAYGWVPPLRAGWRLEKLKSEMRMK